MTNAATKMESIRPAAHEWLGLNSTEHTGPDGLHDVGRPTV